VVEGFLKRRKDQSCVVLKMFNYRPGEKTTSETKYEAET
jgi:hypothetical protein